MQADWQPAPDSLDIQAGELHLWSAQLPAGQPGGMEILTQDEVLRLERYHFQRDRKMFLFARVLLRRLLGRYLDLAPEQIIFDYTAHKKPYLPTSQGQSQLEFNLSHSGELVLVGVALGTVVGVDVEQIRSIPDLDQVAARFFTAGEQQALQTLSGDEKVAAFYHCWTRKEAVIKACGEGLSMPLDRFQVSLLPGESARLLHNPDQRPWLLVNLTPSSGYAAAAAAPAKSMRIRRFNAERLFS